MKQFFRPLKTESLSPNERDALRKRIDMFMREHPRLYSKNRWPLWLRVPILTRHPMFATIFLAMLIALGGGTAAAAERAVPGDALYPFKIHINESVRSAVEVGDDKEADWQNTRAVRRLEEAATLAAEGRLNNDIREKLHQQFAAHERKAATLIAGLNAKGKTDIAADVSATAQTRLEAYDDILDSLKRSRPQAAELINKLRDDVKAEVASVSDVRMKAATTTPNRTEQAAEMKRNAAEKKLKETTNYIEHNNIAIDTAVFAQAKTQLNAAKNAFTAGNTLLAAGSYNEAFLKFQESHLLAQRAKITLYATIKLNSSLIEKPQTTEKDADAAKQEDTTKAKEEKKQKDKTADTDAALKLKGKTTIDAHTDASVNAKIPSLKVE